MNARLTHFGGHRTVRPPQSPLLTYVSAGEHEELLLEWLDRVVGVQHRLVLNSTPWQGVAIR